LSLLDGFETVNIVSQKTSIRNMKNNRNHTALDNPYDGANYLSKAFFWWMNPFIAKGFKKKLNFSDLYSTPTEDLSRPLGEKLQTEWDLELYNMRSQNKKPSFVRALYRAFGFWYILTGTWITVGECIVRPIQGVSLGWLIRDVNTYVTLPPGSAPDYVNSCYWQVFFDGIILIFLTIISLITVHPYVFCTQHTGMKVRVACCNLIYRHSLKLSRASFGHTTVGQMVNLLSNDVNRFDVALNYLQFLVIAPLQAIIVIVLLSVMYLGFYSTMAGSALLLLYVPFQSLMGRWFGKLRQGTAMRTDERVRLMNEIIPAMRVIKMYTWEEPFARMVEQARKNEVRLIKFTSVLRGINMALFFVSSKIILFLCFITYVMIGYSLDAEIVFVSITLFNGVRLLMTLFFPYGVAQAAETLISCSRLQEFLLLPEQEPSDKVDKTTLPVSPKDVRVECQDASARWIITRTADSLSSASGDISASRTSIAGSNGKGNGKSQFGKNGSPDGGQTEVSALRNITMSVKPGQLLIIVGRVGSGKTSVLMSLLGELPITSGKIVIRGKMSYSAQEAWIFSGTIRDNVLFGRDFDVERYKKVLKVCALDRDIELFPHGDDTLVGERGVSLSGGQKARVNLARALYYDTDIYLLDDPLSAVDAAVAKHIFENCIRGFLRDKAVILVTHQLQFAKSADASVKLLLLDDGKQMSYGKYADNKALIDFAGSRSDKSDSESAVRNSGDELAKAKALRLRQKAAAANARASSSRAGDTAQQIKSAEMIYSSSGSLVGTGDAKGRGSGRSVRNDDHDENHDEQLLAGEAPMKQMEESSSSDDVGIHTYWYYIKSTAGIVLVPLVVTSNLLTQFLFNGSDFWLSYWTDTEQRKAANPDGYVHLTLTDDLTLEQNTIVYSILIVSLFVLSLIRTSAFFIACMKASINLHNQLFRSVLKAPIKFFDYNPIGILLNRVSRDMGIVDDLLPPTAFDTIEIFVNVIGVLVTVTIIDPYNVLPAILLLLIVGLIRLFYMRTVRSIKTIEGVTRSPVFTHLATSLNGLSTIRAFGVESTFEKKFDDLQDVHSSAWFLFIASSRWLGISLDWLSVGYIAVVTIVMTLTIGTGSITGSQLGLAISSALVLSGSFQWGVRQSTELESQMTSVARIKEYSELPEEPTTDENDENQRPPPGWPNKGKIEFERVSLRYFENEEPVLKNLTFTIEAGEKIGIVGRTGAGKSSIIAVLFRLTEPEGNVRIDGIDTQTLGLKDVRKNISIIPQSPELFSGPVRRNLDPFNDCSSDKELWDALQQVQLKSVIMELPGGLDSELNEGGSNFSVGQRQLICLARAILRRNKILILDEATANVDPETDKYIQKTIRTSFHDNTVLTIAHRLNTIMDSDRVLVLDAGEVKEFDEPHILANIKGGWFASMIDSSGPMAPNLRKIAEKRYMCQINSVPMKYAIGFLDILTAPSFDNGQTSADVVVAEGANVSLTCKANGYPNPTITWRREDNEMIPLNGLQRMSSDVEGWFTEIGAPKGADVALSIMSKKTLHHERSQYQDILVFESELFGTCLALDDAIQCTEMDEFSYQEMIAFLPLNSHSNPERVLIIGGGDGGVAREVIKHPCAKKIVQCEIDDRVIEVSKKYLPSMSSSYNDPRLELIVGDGFKYLNDAQDEYFDVIITDSSDPKGPAVSLFQQPYYELLNKKLRPNGIICCQAESIWFDLKFIANLMEVNRKIFPCVSYASIMTCTYPGGQIGFLICSKDKDKDFKQSKHELDEDKLGLKYYSRDMHQAAFILPRFVSKALKL
ncbi:Multidrug resistance-associated protein 4, partial [Fragariocoptes setiger]